MNLSPPVFLRNTNGTTLTADTVVAGLDTVGGPGRSPRLMDVATHFNDQAHSTLSNPDLTALTVCVRGVGDEAMPSSTDWNWW